MRKENLELNKYRVYDGPYGSPDSYGTMGLFIIPGIGCYLRVLSSGSNIETNWDHVSVSVKHRCPNWPEMNMIKDLFWYECETVIQFHPRKTEYVNIHPYCLHLWSRHDFTYELPDQYLI